MLIGRRQFLRSAAGAVLAGGVARRAVFGATGPRVVVVGGGFGGATAARYLRLWGPHIQVTLVERDPDFVSCPMSNLVLGGTKSLPDITLSYDTLSSRYGVNIVRGEARAIDVDKKAVRLADGRALPYDRVILSPGVDMIYRDIPGLDNAQAQSKIVHAWKAGPQTAQLRRQLESLKDGGVFAIAIPEMPYRCPPGPYERACQVAAYFKRYKPRCKVVILDANMDVTSKPALFKKAWAEMYPDLIEYRPNSKVIDVDVDTLTAKMEVEDFRADLLNILPPMKAGAIADPFITVNQRWCEVDWLTYESRKVPGVHLLGDSLQVAPLMPKSGTMANAHGKTCAAAVIALLAGEPPNPSPTLVNTCYSYVSPQKVVHIASVHKYDEAERTMKVVPGASGLSASANELEAQYAQSWATQIWADMLQ
jgi:sulfite dehydrogenase